MDRPWFIYVLSSEGNDFYVGRTFNCGQRKKQHRRRFGKTFQMRVVESGAGKEACKAAEIRWIETLIAEGAALANRMIGSHGCWKTGPSTLAKLRNASIRMWEDPEYRRKHNIALRLAMADPMYQEGKRKSLKEAWKRPDARAKMLPQIMSLAKRIRTPEDNAALSAKTKGKRKNWSEEGERRVRTTQFKQGEGRFADLPKELQKKFIAARKKQWDGISKEERARMATERNLQAWAKRDTEQRRKLGVNISQGIAARFSEEERQARAARASLKAAEKWHSMTPEQKALEIEKRGSPEERKALASSASKKLWANMTPERMAEIVAKRKASIKANRELRAKSASA